jgi:signal transduction histidine kinase/CheY-like chemotaxis protein
MFEQKSSGGTYEAEKKAEDCTVGDVTDIPERTRVLAVPLAAVLVVFGVIFAVDLVTPLGIEIWVLYIFALLLASKAAGPSFLWPLAGLSTAFTVVDFFLSPLGVPISYAVVNRAIGVCMFGVVAWLLSEQARHEQRVLVANEALEKRTQELSAERARWQATVENMLDPVTVCDAEGRATYMNRAYQRLIERPVAQDLAMEAHPDYYELYYPDGTLFPAMELPLQKAARTGEDVRDVELIQRSANGREFTAIFSAAPLRDGEGKVTGAVAVGRDITEQRRIERALKETLDELESRVQERTAELQQSYDRLKEETEEREHVEQQLRQAQKMEALGTLAGGIAHDFNNVLAAIIGFSQMAQDKTPEGSPARRHMDRVLAAGLRGRDLVKQILAFSRRAEQEKQPLKLAAVVKEALILLRASLPSTIDIRTNLQSEAGFVLADPTQMQQVIMNLCTNAAHAMRRRGGSISIDLAGFSFSSPEDAPDPTMSPRPYARLSVTDTGDGISPETIEHIFDPFFTTKAAGEGTGLGLSVVHGIVASHGGTITVSSEQNKGSTFTIYLPELLEERPRTSADGGSSIPGGHERILFVDDEHDLTAMASQMLTGLGYHVTARTGAREALALFRSDPSRFDLVISDQTMPEMTGLDLAGEILTLRADMPIIMCTGYSPLVDSDTARAVGIKALAMKPLTKKEIAATIRKVLDERLR